MENDGEVNTDTLDTHILDLNETDGKLYTLPVFYAINILAGDSEYVGQKENWTFDEFVSHWNSIPAGSTIMGSNQKENVYPIVLRNNLDSFIDYENAMVHFDSPDFKKMLEFPTEKDVTELRRYILSVNQWGTMVDTSLEEIIDDEVFAYFNGEESIDDCVDIIQSRASIWISEQS